LSQPSSVPFWWGYLMLAGLPAAIVATTWLGLAKNTYPRGSQERIALRLSRIGLALLFWTLIMPPGTCIPLNVAAFILGRLGYSRGRKRYGLIVMLSSVAIFVFSYLTFGIMSYF